MVDLFERDEAVVPVRGFHLDLKGLPPTPERLVGLLRVASLARYNAVLVEWEDTFPWTCDERFRGETFYTPETIAEFCRTADDLGIEVIPLVQCLGHMETPLGVSGYEHLREDPNDTATLNPLAPGARELVQGMLDDILNLMPKIRYLHLGGDEARNMGSHPDTRAYVDQHGKDRLYLQHVEPILDGLNARNIRPILWHDMMIHWDSDVLKALAGKSDLLVWGYEGHPDTTTFHYNSKYIQRFHDHGITLWGGTAYKGADGCNVDLPNMDQRQKNALAWVEIAQRFGFTGVIATAWSRYSTHSMQCEPIDAALDLLVNTGVILHDGEPPEGGLDACISALEGLGERARFEKCKTAMEHLAKVRQKGWQSIQMLHEQNALLGMDNVRRCDLHIRKETFEELCRVVSESKEIEEEVRNSFAGLLDPVWIEEYLRTRLAPLSEEMLRLDSEPVEQATVYGVERSSHKYQEYGL